MNEYIVGLYKRLLLRTPGANEVAFWEGALANGTSFEGFESTFRGSAEYIYLHEVKFPVIALFLGVLRRAPDAAGLASWAEQFRSGAASFSDVLHSFARSEEFRELHPSHGGGISACDLVGMFYKNILKREPDPAGFDFWVKLINSGQITGNQLSAAFLTSAEFQKLAGNNLRALLEDLADGVIGDNHSALIGPPEPDPGPEPAPTYAAAASTSTADEGGSVTFTLATAHVAAGSVVELDWGGTVGPGDIDGSLPASFTVCESGLADITVHFHADGLTEGRETLSLSVSGSTQAMVTVEDTSLTPVAVLNSERSRLEIAAVDATVALSADGTTAIVSAAGRASLEVPLASLLVIAITDGARVTVAGSEAIFTSARQIDVDVDAQLIVDISYPALTASHQSHQALNLSAVRVAGDNSLAAVWNVVSTTSGELAEKFILFWANEDAQHYDGALGGNEYKMNTSASSFILSEFYVEYLKRGGPAITDIVRTKVGGVPDFSARQQSLHDNLLANVMDAAIEGRFPGQPDPRSEAAKVFGIRPYEDGYPPLEFSEADQWDADHDVYRPDLVRIVADLDAMNDGLSLGSPGRPDSPAGNSVVDQWIKDCAALQQIRTGNADDPGQAIDFVISPDGDKTGTNRYRGTLVRDLATGPIDITDASTAEYKFYIDADWLADGQAQFSGVWIQLQNLGGALSNGRRYVIAEYIDAEASLGLPQTERTAAGLDEGETFTGFRFGNSDGGWDYYLPFEDNGWVTLQFHFGKGEHSWVLNGERVYTQKAGPFEGEDNALLEMEISKSIIFNSQNFGLEEQYTYDDIAPAGVSRNPDFYE
ncbi:MULTISPECIES: DUF4214 domain-containing protein [unclassified Chelatococcus]|uniref:DUF4214 domain-containing protein n=1 Tax=unclassified Chelatococcus TaxID=2638111 RepID=UPI001BCCBF5B|nr:MULTISPECIES: DUF4214 domain-containing protein [unclassified Chelatococcus]MBS7699414.1 DUF4214 domain-containing protein [Chelatococcus sp. YT9]MBX3557694.1 DUF4214 domain-containing protein [Chelatococcus sp.]